MEIFVRKINSNFVFCYLVYFSLFAGEDRSLDDHILLHHVYVEFAATLWS